MSLSDTLDLAVEHGDAATTVSVRGEIDFGNVSRLRATLARVAREGAKDVVIDMSGVTFVDSTGLSVLVQAKQRLESLDRRMSVRYTQPRVTRVLDLAGLGDYLVGGSESPAHG